MGDVLSRPDDPRPLEVPEVQSRQKPPPHPSAVRAEGLSVGSSHQDGGELSVQCLVRQAGRTTSCSPGTESPLATSDTTSSREAMSCPSRVAYTK